MDQFTNLPPPPQGQKGINPNLFAHLPPPPQGQTGLTLAQIMAQQSSTPAGQFNVPAQAPQINHPALLQQLQQTVPQQTAQANAQQGIWGTIKGAAKELGNMFTSSEQGLGQTIGNTLATGQATSMANTSTQADTQVATNFLRTIAENNAAGKDTTHLQQVYNQWKQNQPNGQALPELPTMGQATGQLAGTALDALTFGTYGTAAKGMEAGKLAVQGGASGLVAKTGIPSAVADTANPSLATGLVNTATQPAGLLTKQGAARIGVGGGVGYGYDVTQGLQGNRGADRTGAAAFIPGMNTVLGASIPGMVATADSLKTLTGSRSFNENLNKALPVLKKDVTSLATKQADARTAFSDIVANKDSLGITDKNGEVKLPSDYTFADTVKAQNARLKQIYADYSAKASEADKMKFTANLKKDVGAIKTQLETTLNNTISSGNKAAIQGKIKELKSILDKPYIDPLTIQTYIEDLGKEARVGGGSAPTFKNIQAANIGGVLRGALDKSVNSTGGVGYQDLRNVYKAHKTIQSQLLQAAKSELNKTPGWTDRMANLGMTAEGINFLMTHDPHAIAVGLGIKGATWYTKWLRSPHRALSNMFKEVEKAQSISPRPLSPEAINHSATIVPKNTIRK